MQVEEGLRFRRAGGAATQRQDEERQQVAQSQHGITSSWSNRRHHSLGFPGSNPGLNTDLQGHAGRAAGMRLRRRFPWPCVPRATSCRLHRVADRVRGALWEQHSMDVIRIILSVIIPPVGVFLQVGFGLQFWLNILLTLLGYIPGLIHAIYIIVSR
jgi:uncharacterized membrane protein YqaE (UPF0057 family)